MNLQLVLKFFTLRIATHFLAKKIKPLRSNVGFSKARTIGVLYSYGSPEKHEILQRFIRNLKNLDKQIGVLCYTVAKDRVHQGSNLLYSFDHEALTPLGRVHSDRIQKFIDTPFDYLFHIDLDSNPILDFIVAKSNAKCRIGYFDTGRKNLFEVMVKVNRVDTIEDIKKLTAQILHYTECMES